MNVRDDRNDMNDINLEKVICDSYNLNKSKNYNNRMEMSNGFVQMKWNEMANFNVRDKFTFFSASSYSAPSAR